MVTRIIQSYDSLYDKVIGDNDFIDEDSFRLKVDELVDNGYIETGVLDDTTIYYGRHKLNWSEFYDMEDAIMKSILLLLVENPITFFVLQNTQKGKMRIASNEIKKWGQDSTKKVVAFMIVDNDATLADQSVDGIKKTFGNQSVKIFSLQSNSGVTFESIKTYIDAYEGYIMDADEKEPEYPMPLIALLANPKQNEKMVNLLHHIHKKVVMRKSNLRYGIIYDEADKTYPLLRKRDVIINGVSVSCYTYIVEKTEALHRLGFVSATEGDLLDEDYPECANAYLYPVEISQEDEKYYRALHLPEAITHRVPFKSNHTNNTYAIQILQENKDHFMQSIVLSSGEIYYKKIIVNSNSKTDDMKNFAKWCNQQGMNALVFNGYGGTSVKIYKIGSSISTHKTKNSKLNELLFYIYKKYDLNDKPLLIIGRRKVDRGLGFHYAPRTNDEICIPGSMGDLITRDKEGLIWTDEILGRITVENIASQKAGRLAGIIGFSPQYCGETHYWTDEYTENLVRTHNTIVDKSNTIRGCSVGDAVKLAVKMTPIIKVNHRVKLDTFLVYTDKDIVKRVCDQLGYTFRSINPSTEGPNIGFIETSLNKSKEKASLLDAIKKVPGAYGTNNGVITWRTYLPCYKDTNDVASLHFVVVVRPGTDAEKLEMVKQEYPSIIIPQEGDF